MLRIRYGLISLSLFMFGAFASLQAQNITVQGTVVDAETGEPLPGVNILVKGTSIGTATERLGYYSLSVPEGRNVLVFSFIGYATQEVQINGRTTIDVALEPTTIRGENLVVVGYGVQQREDVTGAISSVDMEQAKKIPTSSLLEALQGKVAGLQIVPTSGQPGAQPVVRIRGVGTLNNASPLFVVDGLLTDDISYINPANVESVEVLKDASATAIYGSRGANGVIIITTERGQRGQVPQVSVNAYYGIQQVSNEIDMANAQQFAILANESAANTGDPPVFENPQQFGVGTDWQDLIFDSMAAIQNYVVTATGGTDNMVYAISGSYFNQTGVVRGSDFERVGLRLNNEYFLSDHVSIGHNISLTYEDSQDAAGGLVNAALRADPTLPPRNENGEFTNASQNGGAANPAAAIAFNSNDQFAFRTAGNAYLNIEFLKNFDFKSSFALDLKRGKSQDFIPEFFVSPIQSNNLSKLTVRSHRRIDWILKNTLKYKKDLQQHSFDLLAGITLQKHIKENLGGGRTDFPGFNPTFFFLDLGNPDSQTNFNDSQSVGRVSYLFRVNYTFKDRYLFTGTYRIDGSSKFGAANRYGYFPSVGLGWRISEEPFFDVPGITNLKIRGSWGIIGNDKIPVGAAIPTVRSGLSAVFGENQTLRPGATVTALANPNLQWEETEQWDIGIELGMFNNRLTAQLDYYNKETHDILVSPPIPGYVGAGAPIVNAASVRNKGFEVSIAWQESRGDFIYDISFVGATIDNEVLALGENQGKAIFAARIRNLGLTTRTAIGGPIGAFYGLKIIGVFDTQQQIANAATRPNIDEVPGDLRFADLNGDGEITEADRTVLGSPIPDYTFGLNLSAAYKGFDLSVSFDGQFGNKILNAHRAARGFRLLNYSALFLNRWHGPGTSNTEPRITESGYNYVVDRFLQDGDFVRLRNIQLGYTLPVNVTENLSVRSVRIYVNASNLVTFTSFSGYNPQIGSDNVLANNIAKAVYPIATTYTVGIALDF